MSGNRADPHPPAPSPVLRPAVHARSPSAYGRGGVDQSEAAARSRAGDLWQLLSHSRTFALSHCRQTRRPSPCWGGSMRSTGILRPAERGQTRAPAQAAAAQVATMAMAFSTGRMRATGCGCGRIRDGSSVYLLDRWNRISVVRSYSRTSRTSVQRTRAIIQRASGLLLRGGEHARGAGAAQPDVEAAAGHLRHRGALPRSRRAPRRRPSSRTARPRCPRRSRSGCSAPGCWCGRPRPAWPSTAARRRRDPSPLPRRPRSRSTSPPQAPPSPSAPCQPSTAPRDTSAMAASGDMPPAMSRACRSRSRLLAS